MNRSALPLSGVTVVDFGQYIAGPAVAMILGDLGARVVHIDPPGGPRWQSPANAVLMRNKLCITLDLKAAEGLTKARALIAQADILVENFRPGVMARLGLDLATLRGEQPGLITVSLPGFASGDDLRREWRAFEGVIAAASGVFTDMGLNRVLMGRNPCYSPLPLASAYGTMLGASAAVLALQARERTGLGDQIEVPLASAVMEGLTYNSLHIDDYPLRYQTQREREIERRKSADLPMDMGYGDLQEFLDPFYRSYECRDGRMFYVVCPSHRHHAKRCLQTLGIYDELVAEGLQEEPDTYLPVSEWQSDVSLGVYPLPKHWADKIAARMKAVFLTRTAKEWERIFGKGRFPGAPQRWLSEWISDDHAEVSGLMIPVDDPEYGPMIQPGPMAWLAESGEAMLSPAPRQAVDPETALAALRAAHRPPVPKQAQAGSGGWLDGLRVLDLCNVIAGPHSVAYLARFGASVIKLDPATPLYDCWNTVIFGMTHMRGKQSVLADLHGAEGRKLFEDLVKSVDVVVWNATDRQVAAMGLDAESLARINPDAIFCQLDCFGGIRPGPRTDYLGYDDLVQAATGIMLRFGGSMQTPEEHAHVGTIDVMCGFGAALGVGAALFQKQRSGVVGRPRASLSALSGLAQIPFCHDYQGRGPFDEASGQGAMGSSALNHLYRAADGWIMLAAVDADLPRLADALGLLDLVRMDDAACEAALADAFATRPAADWQRILHAANIGVAVCGNIAAIRAAVERPADGTPGNSGNSYAFSRFDTHPSGHGIVQLDACAVRTVVGKVLALPSAEKYGASTRVVLGGLGYDAATIERLIQNGTISESWSREYLPC